MGRFIDNDNGTITDISTWLMWEKEGYENPIPFKTAVESLSYNRLRGCDSGYKDWRLPTLNELREIVYHCEEYISEKLYWSSTVDISDNSHYHAYNNRFRLARLVHVDSECYVKCVRNITEKEKQEIMDRFIDNHDGTMTQKERKKSVEHKLVGASDSDLIKAGLGPIEQKEPTIAGIKLCHQCMRREKDCKCKGDNMNTKDIVDSLPRRSRMDMWTTAEKKIQEAVDEVEKIGADVLLTDAVNLLDQAREKVADYVDREFFPLSTAEKLWESMKNENGTMLSPDVYNLRKFYLEEIKRLKDIIDNTPKMREMNTGDIKLAG